MQKPFWEESYLSDDVSAFGTDPNPTIVKHLHAFKPGGKVLDIGCGEGQNDLFLAQNGFVVNAFDSSPAGIAKLRRAASKQNIAINAWVQDLREYEFNQKYDIVMSFGTFHFVGKDDWKYFIRNAQKNTNKGGIHVMQIFTDVLPATPDIAPFVKGLAGDGDLETLYKNWTILESLSYIFDDEHPGAEKHQHASNKIVARK